nr:MAG: RNA-dependent RNA polymerase [Mitovirus sp.]
MLRTINSWLLARGGLEKIPNLLSLLFGVSPVYRSGLRLLAKNIRVLTRKNGQAFTVLYLKESVRIVYLYLAGVKSLSSQGPPFVSLSGSLPVIIPARLRGEIRSGHRVLTMSVLTLLSVYRGLISPPKLKLNSITDPFTGSVDDFVGFQIYVPQFLALLPKFRLRKPTIWLSTSVGPHGLMGSVSAIRDAAALLSRSNRPLLATWKSLSEGLYGKRATYLIIAMMGWCAICHTALYPVWRSLEGTTSWLSRLHHIEEAAGKVRVVAILDYWSQLILKPIHKAVFNILRVIPNDGTFDQESAVLQFREKLNSMQTVSGEMPTAYSYDLSSATDRIPVHFYHVLLGELLGFDLATRWKSLLLHRNWWDREHTWSEDEGFKPSSAWIPRQYLVGQPMGAYSSWALLALAHHAIVQYAAHLEGGEGWFDGYIIVGDDVVILDDNVARKYLEIVTGFGVEISAAKSIISKNGVFEFCKRLNGPRGDLTGIPLGLIHQAMEAPLDSAPFFRHLLNRGFSLLPIAVNRTLSFLIRVSPRHDVPVRKLRIEIRIVLSMLVQPGFPFWRGIFLMHALPSLSIESLEEILLTGAKPASDELGMYAYLDERAFKGYLANLNPMNWIKALETVPKGVDRWLSKGVFIRLWLAIAKHHKIKVWFLLVGTPLGWWLMSRTINQLLDLVGMTWSAFRDTMSVPGTYSVAWNLIFWRRRIRDRVLESYRGNSLEYFTALARARGKGMFDLSFSGDALRKEVKERRNLAWAGKALRGFKPTLPEAEPGEDLEGR